MRIYTKTGDKGMTRIIGGSKVSKDNVRIDAYGTLDELNSLIGFTITTLGDEPEIQAELNKFNNNYLMQEEILQPKKANVIIN